MNNIGCCYTQRHDFDKAKDMFKEALRIYNKTHSDHNHLDIINNLWNIESLHQQQTNSYRLGPNA